MQQSEHAKSNQQPGTYAPEGQEPLKDSDLRLGRRLLLVVPTTWLLYSAIVWVQGIASRDDFNNLLGAHGGGDLGVLLGAIVLVVPMVVCYGLGAWLTRGAWRKNNWPERPDRQAHPVLSDVLRLRRLAFVLLLGWWSVVALPRFVLSLVFEL